MVTDFLHNLGVLLRTDSIIAEIRLKQLVAASGLGAIAFFFIFFAVAMFNVAGSLAIAAYWTKPWAACAVAGADIFVAMAVMLRVADPESARALKLALDTRRAAFKTMESSMPWLLIAVIEMLSKKDKKTESTESQDG